MVKLIVLLSLFTMDFHQVKAASINLIFETYLRSLDLDQFRKSNSLLLMPSRETEDDIQVYS